MTSVESTERPPFSSLPLDPQGPPGNAWGLYGANDALGALNILTPSTVATAASQEIKTGVRVSLDWPLNKPTYPSFDRPAFKATRNVRKAPDGKDRCVNDDHLDFNTQCSSQWDGFRHYGYQKARRFYGNVSLDQLDDPSKIGIDAWVENGGIVGRGVLIDYAAYCQRHSIPIKAFSSVAIPLSDLINAAKEQETTFQKGDILLVRSGFTEAYDKLDDAQQRAIPERPSPDFIGVEASQAMLQWIWETGFAAVAGDMPSFEQAPIAGHHTRLGGIWKAEPWEEEMQGGGLLHQWLLGGWGLPIGEMFDLETLSVKCQELKRWSFFLSSVPLKVPGGVASPPNAIAIF